MYIKKSERTKKIAQQEISVGNYLLILDDVWETNRGLPRWRSLKLALPQRNDGSCVLFTIRHERVVKSMGALEKHIHRPQIL